MSKTVILFIDEQQTEIEAHIDYLTATYGGRSFYYAQTSSKGLEYLGKHYQQIACISLDLLMPNFLLRTEDRERYALEGLYLLKVIREEYPSIPVVCYSFIKEEFANEFIKKYKAEYIYKGDRNSYRDLLKIFDKTLSK